MNPAQIEVEGMGEFIRAVKALSTGSIKIQNLKFIHELSFTPPLCDSK